MNNTAPGDEEKIKYYYFANFMGKDPIVLLTQAKTYVSLEHYYSVQSNHVGSWKK